MTINNTQVFANVNTKVVCKNNTKVLNCNAMKMTYGQRLKLARIHKGLSQPELAKKSEVSQATISKIERGDQNYSGYDAQLSYALDIQAMWLSKGDDVFAPDWLLIDQNISEAPSSGPALPVGNVEPGPDIKGKIPLISWVQAGHWCESVDLYAPGDAEIWLPCPVTHGPHAYALRVKGDSMTNSIPGQRSYPEGMIIFVDPDKPITNGCRVIAKLSDLDEATFKEYREDSGKRYLMPLNRQYDKIEITAEVHICGVVIFAGWQE